MFKRDQTLHKPCLHSDHDHGCIKRLKQLSKETSNDAHCNHDNDVTEYPSLTQSRQYREIKLSSVYEIEIFN